MMLTTILEMEGWRFVRDTNEVTYLIHLCKTDNPSPYLLPNYDIRITTFTARNLKLCTYCDETVPDDVYSALHLLIPRKT